MWMFRFFHGGFISIWGIIFCYLFCYLLISKKIIHLWCLVYCIIYFLIIEFFINPKVEKFMDKFWEKHSKTAVKVQFDKRGINFLKNNIDKINFRQFGICPYCLCYCLDYVYSEGNTVVVDKKHGYRYNLEQQGFHSVAERIRDNGKLYDQYTIGFKKDNKIDIEDLQSKFKDL